MAGPLGTLIVVILKARNLPNKQRIGKQDPYATCTYLSHRKRTRTDKRGGQHPFWDDEVRFEIYEKPSDAMPASAVATTSTGGVVPVKDQKGGDDLSTAAGAGLGSKAIKVAVYADDPKDPELIGEGKVELTDTLQKGEFDEWVTITNKGKYQGEVYLEMTYYPALPPPERRKGGTPQRAGVHETQSPKRRWTVSRPQPTLSIPASSPGTFAPTNVVTSASSARPPPLPARQPSPLPLESVPDVLRVGASEATRHRPPGTSMPSSNAGALPLPGQPGRNNDVLPASASESLASSMAQLNVAVPMASISGSTVTATPFKDNSLPAAKVHRHSFGAYWPPQAEGSARPGFGTPSAGSPSACIDPAGGNQAALPSVVMPNRPPQPHSAPPGDPGPHHSSQSSSEYPSGAPANYPAEVGLRHASHQTPVAGQSPGRRPLPMPEPRPQYLPNSRLPQRPPGPEADSDSAAPNPLTGYYQHPQTIPQFYPLQNSAPPATQGPYTAPTPSYYPPFAQPNMSSHQSLPPPPPGQTPVPFQQVLRASTPLPPTSLESGPCPSQHPGQTQSPVATSAPGPLPPQGPYAPPYMALSSSQPASTVPYPQTPPRVASVALPNGVPTPPAGYRLPAAAWQPPSYGVPMPVRVSTPLPPPPPGQVPYAYGPGIPYGPYSGAGG